MVHTCTEWQDANDRGSFMAHPETMLPITKIEDPVQRFVAVTKFYLSGWHIKPPYVSCVLLSPTSTS
jgi:hypothetical protein